MALTIGELVGYIGLDDSGVDQGITHTRREMERLADWMSRIAEDAGDQAGRLMGDALAQAAIAELDSAYSRFRAAGEQAGDAVIRAAEDALRAGGSGLTTAGQRAGDAYGDGLVRGADGALRDGEGRIVTRAGAIGDAAGRRAGDGLGDGMTDGASDGADDAVTAAEGKLGKLKGGAAAIGALAGAALMAGMTEAMEQGKVLSMMEASMGATPQLMEKYGEVAGNLFANAVTEDFQTAADAVAETMNYGLLPTDATERQIETMSTGLADVAALMGEEVGPTARAVGKMIKTGLVDDGAEALDILTRGVQTNSNEAEDLLDTFGEYSIQFRKLGLDADGALGLISQGLQGGARDADIVADALKEFSIRAVDGSTASADAFAALGLDAEEMTAKIALGGDDAAAGLDTVLDRLRRMEDPVKREAAAVGLFGTQAEDLGSALFALDPSEAVAALGEVGGAAKEAGDTMRDNASTRVEQFKRRLTQDFVEFLGSEVIPAAQDLKRELGPAFAAVGEGARAFWEQAGPGLRGLVSLARQIGSAFRGMEGDASGSMSSTGGWIRQTMSDAGAAVSAFTTTAREIWRIFGGDFLSIARNWFRKTKGEIQGTLDIVMGVLRVIGGIMRGDWSMVWKGIRQAATGALTSMLARVRGLLGLLGTAVRMNLRMIGTVFLAAWDGIQSGAGGAFRWVVNSVSGWLDRMRDNVRDRISDAVGFFRGLKDRVGGVLSGAGDWLYNAGRSIIQGLIDGVRSKVGDLLGTIGDVAGQIRDFLPFSPAKRGPLRDHPPDEAGATIGAMIADGLRGAVPDVAAAARAAAGSVQMPITTAAPAMPVTAGPGVGAARPQVVRVVLDVRGGDDDLVRMVRRWVSDNGGGNVQSALGR